jgi:hypothetical protein
METTAPGDVPPFAFNCHFATPMRRQDDAVLAVDLWLDVLVRSDGTTVSTTTTGSTRPSGMAG